MTHYDLALYRQVDLRFTRVKEVTVFYPLSPETAEILGDAFLKELASRRADTAFHDIIFSIQKKQGDIIRAPYQQNLIVQGCAGSGKSMIMMHRLPIVLYDNPKTIERNSVYIITPSRAYIQMAEEMREELGIADLTMGTMNEYYAHCISKYTRNMGSYGKIDPSIRLPGRRNSISIRTSVSTI